MCAGLPRLLIVDGEAFSKVKIQYETTAVVGSYLAGALVILAECKYIIVLPTGFKLKKGEPYPFGTRVYVNSIPYRENSMSDKKAAMARVNEYNRGLAGEGRDCLSVKSYEQKYMTLQCVEKVLRDHKERGLFSVWDCDCRNYVYEKQCQCSVLSRHLDPEHQMNVDSMLQELPANKKAGRPSKSAQVLALDHAARPSAPKRSSVAVQGDRLIS